MPASRGLRWLSSRRQDHPDHQQRLGARGRGPREGSPTGRASDHRLGVSGTQLPGRSPRPWAWHVPIRGQASHREHHYCRLNPCPALAPGPEEICGPVPSSGPTCAHPPSRASYSRSYDPISGKVLSLTLSRSEENPRNCLWGSRGHAAQWNTELSPCLGPQQDPSPLALREQREHLCRCPHACHSFGSSPFSASDAPVPETSGWWAITYTLNFF